MSLFGSFMRDFEDDPFYGSHMSTMNSMMNSMLSSDPFGMFGGFGGMGGMGGMGMGGMGMGGMSALTGPSRGHRGGELMPFGFPNMNDIFQNFQQMNPNDPNCHSFSSSTVMTMTNGPDGRPQVYQASHSTRTAPGGIKETKKSVSDTRTGTKRLAIGHHIGERSHVLEREQNVISGEQEERQEFINLEEDEADDFNREWERKTRNTVNAIDYGSSHRNHSRRHYREELPAILDRSRTRPRHTARRTYPAITASPSSEHERAKKRIHEEHVISSDDEEEEQQQPPQQQEKTDDKTSKKSHKTVKSSKHKKH